jgi:hypothetical protein
MPRGQVLNRDFRLPFVASGVLSSLAPNGKVINQDLTLISFDPYFLRMTDLHYRLVRFGLCSTLPPQAVLHDKYEHYCSRSLSEAVH